MTDLEKEFYPYGVIRLLDAGFNQYSDSVGDILRVTGRSLLQARSILDLEGRGFVLEENEGKTWEWVYKP